ncbi:glutaredoxin family protein [Bacillus gobiensis]|uniref:glutaredoxin family protein n=1 Tax=Bacillus gobiensis TaxID=1441095 RepID=UPI003D1D0997
MNEVVKVFINPTCGPCINLKEWLDEKDIPYIQRDVVNNQEAATEFKEIDGQFTPTTLITSGDEKYKVIGFNPQKIERILSLNEETDN